MGNQDYDPTLDEVLSQTDLESESGKGGTEVKICSYKKGKPSIRINHYFISEQHGGRQYTKGISIKPESWEKIRNAVDGLLESLK